MSRETFNHTNCIEVAGPAAFGLPRRQTMLAGDAWTASPALVGSRI
jgi:hypothetical protein